MTTVIGGDLALAKTGLAVWTDGDVRLRTIRTSKDDGDKPVRWSMLCREVAAEVPFMTSQAERPRSLFVCEGIYHRVGFGAVGLDLAAVRAVVLLRMYAMDVPTVVCTPQNAKILATGNGAAKKPDMVAAARDILRLTPRNDDEADAAWLMAAGLTRFPEGRAWLADRGVATDRPWSNGIAWPTMAWADMEVPDGTGRGARQRGREAAG